MAFLYFYFFHFIITGLSVYFLVRWIYVLLAWKWRYISSCNVYGVAFDVGDVIKDLVWLIWNNMRFHEISSLFPFFFQLLDCYFKKERKFKSLRCFVSSNCFHSFPFWNQNSNNCFTLLSTLRINYHQTCSKVDTYEMRVFFLLQ